MGVKGAHPFLHKHNCMSDAIPIEMLIQPETTLYIDFLGSFYSLIQRFAWPKQWDALAQMVTMILPPKDGITIVLDGQPTLEKNDAHLTRSHRRSQQCDQLKDLLEKIEQSERVSKSVWKKVTITCLNVLINLGKVFIASNLQDVQ